MLNQPWKSSLLICCSVLAVSAAQAQTESENQSSTSEVETDAASSEDAATLQPVTVTANRKKKALLETPGNVSSVGREELDRRMDNVLDDIFRYETGIEVPKQTTGTDPFSSSGGVQIRGVGGNRTQVLVDGNRTVERITDSTRDIVDSSNVKAVEVVRGPSSVLWGSDGLGGTINFVTKDPVDYLKPGEDFGGSGSLNYGSVDSSFTESVTGAARISSKLEGLISFTRRDAEEVELSNARNGTNAVQNCTRNPEATSCDEFDPTDINSNNLLAKLVFKPSAENQIRLTGEYFTRDTHVDQNSVLGDEVSFGSVVSEITNYEQDQEIKRWRLSLDQDWVPATDLLDRVKWQVTYSPQEINKVGDRYRILDGSGQEERRLQDQQYKEAFYELDLQLESSFDLGKTNHILTYGFDGDVTTTDYSREDTTTNITLGTTTVARAGGFNFANASTTRADVYLQDEVSLFEGRWKITPGARLANYIIEPDTDSDYQLIAGAEPKTIRETDLQLKLGTIFELTNTYSVYGNYSQGFKMPTAQQLYQSLDSLPFFALVPNANLEPESVDSFEVGFRGDYGKKGFFSVNAFYAKYDNFILNFVDADPLDYGFAPGTMTLTYDNVDSLELYGFEASAGFRINDHFSTRLGFSYQEGTIEDGGVESTYNGALPFSAVTGLRYNDKALGLDVELVGTFQAGDVDVDDPATEYSPKGFAVFDLIAGWEAMPNLTLHAGLYNIFNTRYFPGDVRGYPINGTDAVKSTNPIELQTAPGRNFKIGVSYNF